MSPSGIPGQQPQQQPQQQPSMGLGMPNANLAGAAGGMGGGVNNPAAGAGGNLNIASLPLPMQQAYQVLQVPNHPFVQHMIARVPGFKQMPLQIQLQRMVQMQVSVYYFCFLYSVISLEFGLMSVIYR